MELASTLAKIPEYISCSVNIASQNEFCTAAMHAIAAGVSKPLEAIVTQITATIVVTSLENTLTVEKELDKTLLITQKHFQRDAVSGRNVRVLLARLPAILISDKWRELTDMPKFLEISLKQGVKADEEVSSIKFVSTNRDDKNNTIDLLLSGGGYRATLFHIGVLRFLYEHCQNDNNISLLHKARNIVGVSGGSITAAHCVLHFSEYLANFEAASKALLYFISTNDIRRQHLQNNKRVADVIKSLLGDDSFASLASHPQLHILGTSLRTGGCVAFCNDGIKHYTSTPQSNYKFELSCETDRAEIPIRYAIEASAAFPPIMAPLKISASIYPGSVRSLLLDELNNTEVADGGIRDNLGLEYYRHVVIEDAPTNECLISDAGRLFDHVDQSVYEQSLLDWKLRAERTIEIQGKRLSDLDLYNKGNAIHISLHDASYVGVSENTEVTPFSQPLTRCNATLVANTRTDLTILSPSEIYSIVRLGYDLAAAKLGASCNKRTALVDGKYWKNLWPAENTSQESLYVILAKQNEDNAKLFNSDTDMLNHLPLNGAARLAARTGLSAYRMPWKIILIIIAALITSLFAYLLYQYVTKLSFVH